MKRVLILCEGQTEETFVTRILAPHLLGYNIVTTPKVLVTKKVKSGYEFKGGITSYPHVRRDVQNLLRDTAAVCVTTLLDYYGLPDDFPGKSTLPKATPYQRVEYLENAFAQDIANQRFLPYLMLHEFEALLFVDLSAVGDALARAVTPQSFGDLSRFSTPEEINEGKQTHPAARLQRALPGYRKPLHGPLAVERIGLPNTRARCHHFDAWLRKLEAL
ncbi:MAG TPA: DUF4276 family protein [Anaerolineae bacterium]|nr:DUF4276 family protein [Anaerolineae bacterium]